MNNLSSSQFEGLLWLKRSKFRAKQMHNVQNERQNAENLSMYENGLKDHRGYRRKSGRVCGEVVVVPSNAVPSLGFIREDFILVIITMSLLLKCVRLWSLRVLSISRSFQPLKLCLRLTIIVVSHSSLARRCRVYIYRNLIIIEHCMESIRLRVSRISHLYCARKQFNKSRTARRFIALK